MAWPGCHSVSVHLIRCLSLCMQQMLGWHRYTAGLVKSHLEPLGFSNKGGEILSQQHYIDYIIGTGKTLKKKKKEWVLGVCQVLSILWRRGPFSTGEITLRCSLCVALCIICGKLPGWFPCTKFSNKAGDEEAVSVQSWRDSRKLCGWRGRRRVQRKETPERETQ